MTRTRRKNNLSNFLVFGRWPQTKIGELNQRIGLCYRETVEKVEIFKKA